MGKLDVSMSVFYSNPALKVARDAIRESNKELDAMPRHLLDTANPNHPDYDNKIFGYDEKEFLARQHK